MYLSLFLSLSLKTLCIKLISSHSLIGGSVVASQIRTWGLMCPSLPGAHLGVPLSQGLLCHSTSLYLAAAISPDWPGPAAHPLHKPAGRSSTLGGASLGPPRTRDSMESQTGRWGQRWAEPTALTASDGDHAWRTSQAPLRGHHGLGHSRVWFHQRLVAEVAGGAGVLLFTRLLSGAAPFCSTCSGSEAGTSCSGPAHPLAGAAVGPSPKWTTVN